MGDSDSICSYNKMIDCAAKTGCEKCGWNPKVSAQRVKALKRSAVRPEGVRGPGNRRMKST